MSLDALLQIHPGSSSRVLENERSLLNHAIGTTRRRSSIVSSPTIEVARLLVDVLVLALARSCSPVAET